MEVKARLEREAKVVSTLLSQIGSLTQTAKEKLIRADLAEIGNLMNGNHQLLQELGVSCLELDRLVSTARNAGALGAKLCGSGKGGNMIALAHPIRRKISVQIWWLPERRMRSSPK
jgi:mevalonate kinase